MKSFASSLGKSKKNKFVHLSPSAVTVLALARAMNATNTATIKVPTAKELVSTSV